MFFATSPDVVRFRLRTKHVVIAITVFDGPFGLLTSCEPALNGTTDLVRRFGHCGVNYSEPLQRMLSSRRLHPKAVATLRPHYPLPLIEKVATRLDKAKVFSVLDAKNGFWQVQLDKESSFLTTFNMPFGRYCWLHLPFGIKTAPEEYQRQIHESLQGLSGIEDIVDDILCVGEGDTY